MTRGRKIMEATEEGRGRVGETQKGENVLFGEIPVGIRKFK